MFHALAGGARVGDVIFLLAPIVFFGLAVAYVRGCAAVVEPGADEAPALHGTDDPTGGAS